MVEIAWEELRFPDMIVFGRIAGEQAAKEKE